MDMTKQAIETLINAEIKPYEHIVEHGDLLFAVDKDGNVGQIKPKLTTLADEPLQLRNLSSLVDYIKSDLDRKGEKLYVHIMDNRKVAVKSILQRDGSREVLAVAQPQVPNLDFNYYRDSEEFLIDLNAKFVNEYDRANLISFAGNVKEEDARQTSDDGFSQKTTVKRGVASVQEEIVPNPVKLTPYRTFHEIKQVPSEFIFRMSHGPKFGLFEADGGAWINETILLTEEYLVAALNDEIESGKIIILS